MLLDQKTVPCWKVWDAPPLTVSSSPVGQLSHPSCQPWALQYCWMTPVVNRAPVRDDQWICPYWNAWDAPPLSLISSVVGKPRSCRCLLIASVYIGADGMNIGAIHRAILVGAFSAALDCGDWRDFCGRRSQPCVWRHKHQSRHWTDRCAGRNRCQDYRAYQGYPDYLEYPYYCYCLSSAVVQVQ